jgi:hypothetical protein
LSHELAERLFDFAVIATAIAAVSGMIVNALLIHRLKSLHPRQWTDLGSPGFLANSIGATLRFQRFIFGTGHRSLNDQTFNKLALASRALLCLVAALLVGGLVIIALQWSAHPPAQTQNGIARNHPLNRYGAAILGSIALWLTWCSSLFSYLKRSHTDLWKQLGSPSVFMNNTISNNFKVIGFVWSADHYRFGDAKLSAAVFLTRFLNVGVIAFLFVIGPRA